MVKLRLSPVYVRSQGCERGDTHRTLRNASGLVWGLYYPRQFCKFGPNHKVAFQLWTYLPKGCSNALYHDVLLVHTFHSSKSGPVITNTL